MIHANLDRTMMALADPTRRAILKYLSQKEARVTEIARPFDMSLNAVSKHLLILERARLVQRRRQGREHFLSANPAPLNEAADWINEYRRTWEERLDRLGDYLKELQAKEKNDDQSKEKKNGRKKTWREKRQHPRHEGSNRHHSHFRCTARTRMESLD
jgi:DNA-binding transcriptional ArsR family regulator